MRKKINGVWYDTSTAPLIAEMEGMTAFSGRMSIELYRSQNGQWFQCIRPTNTSGNQTTISYWISSNTAKTWLGKHSFSLQLREYFNIPECRLRPERQILVAERKSPNTKNPHDLIQVEKLYHHPRKGWCLQQTKGSMLIPLTGQEAARLVKSLGQKKGHAQTPLPVLEQYLYEDEHSRHRRIAS